MIVRRVPWLPIAAGMMVAGAPSVSWAQRPSKEQCLTANVNAQSLRRQGKLADARVELHACADAACPPMVRDDCAQRIDELDHVQPTVVFEVKSSSGDDVSAVRVDMDGRPLAASLTGAALSVDPGSHVFLFTAEGAAPVRRSLLLSEGVRDRREVIVLGKPEGVAGASTLQIAGFAVGGAGLLAIIVGSVFGGLALAEVSQQNNDCKSPTVCPSPALAASAHSTALGEATASTVGLVAGGALLLTGVVMVLAGRAPPSPAQGFLMPSVGPGEAGMVWRGRF